MIKKLNGQFTYAGLILIISFLFTGCANKPDEHFSENFYQFKNEDGIEHFTYIIKLKGMINRNSRADYINAANNPRNHRDTDERRQNSQNMESAFELDDPNDINVSLKFRMEDIAYKKLQVALDLRKYCLKGIKVESEEYLEYSYKIKGYCVK